MSNTVTPPATEVTSGTTAATGRPASSYGTAPHDPSKPPVKRQIVCFSFYKVMPEWRRLPAEEKAAHKAAFAAVLAKWNKPGEFLSLTYSTVGTRGDVDMCVWSIGYAVDELNEMRSELLRSPLGGYLSSPHAIFSDDETQPVPGSTGRMESEGEDVERFVRVDRST